MRRMEDSPATSARASSMISVDRMKSVVMAWRMIWASSTGPALSCACEPWPKRSRIFSPPSKHR